MTIVPVLLILSAQLSYPQTKPPAPQELKFAWPERIEAVVETERSKEQREGTTVKKKSLVKARYRMQVEPHAKGRILRFTQHEILEPKVDGLPAQDVAQLLTSLSPSFVITTDGEFAGVQDIEALTATIEKMVAPIRKEAAGTGIDEMLKGITSEAFLAAASQQEWDALVGNWVGAELRPRVENFEGSAPMPLFPNTEILLKGTVGMVGTAPCSRGTGTFSCATFELKSAADQKSVQTVLEQMLRGVKGMEGVRYEHFDIQTVVRVTLETHTMLPHDFSMTKTVTMTVSKAGEGRFEGAQVDSRTAKYRYVTPSAER